MENARAPGTNAAEADDEGTDAQQTATVWWPATIWLSTAIWRHGTATVQWIWRTAAIWRASHWPTVIWRPAAIWWPAPIQHK